MSDRNKSNRFPCNLAEEAIVDEAIRPGQRGRVKYNGSYWWAYCWQEILILPASSVFVVDLDRDSLTLIVELRITPMDTNSLIYV